VSSFTTAAGRSITSPAAIRFTVSDGNNRIACGVLMPSRYTMIRTSR
jgi:hypothetical protein